MIVALGYDGDIATLQPGRPVAAPTVTRANWSMVTLDGRVVTVPHQDNTSWDRLARIVFSPREVRG